ncbi:MAG: family 1 glycosylhydrolase, partial [Bdellovibrionales bacterium]|nr:family 1 glycosylhydrolase [Bdellovibrionales bacterium]
KPRRKWHPMDRLLAFFIRRLYNEAWPKAITGKTQNFSLPGLIPNMTTVSEARNRRTVDFLGINYYTKAYLRFGSSDDTWKQTGQKIPITVTFAKPNEPMSDLGWAVYPKGFDRILRWACKYGVPVLVTENGIADESDRLRPQYLKDHLLVVSKLRDEGYPITGYYYWSLLDNFEWIKGFKPRFGLYRVNYETFERSPTSSADLLKHIIEAHTMKGLKAPSTEILNEFLNETTSH